MVKSEMVYGYNHCCVSEPNQSWHPLKERVYRQTENKFVFMYMHKRYVRSFAIFTITK